MLASIALRRIIWEMSVYIGQLADEAGIEDIEPPAISMASLH
jgi:hypothetical protein